MKIKIAILDNPIYAKLFSGIDSAKEKFDLEVYPVDEKRCEELVLTNRVDTALVTPLIYGKAPALADLRIVPRTALSAEDFTGIASIFFRKGLVTIDSICSKTPDDYLMQMSKIILAERYDIQCRLAKTDERKSFNESCDARVDYGGSSSEDGALDVTEEWFHTYETKLPLAFWVCRAEEHPENIEEIIDSLKSPNFEKDELISIPDLEPGFRREGRISHAFEEDFSAALDETLKLLFYHRLINEIPAIKILGEDENPEN